MVAPRLRGKPGPVPKGARAQFTIRVPEEHMEIYRQRADEAGLPVGDYIAVALAHRHGLPTPEYVHRRRRGPEREDALPIAV